MADRDSYTDKTAPKWPHGRDDMVFNRESSGSRWAVTSSSLPASSFSLTCK